MKTLPKGVYVVSKPFKYLEESRVSFSFKGQTYQAVKGENAFASFEELVQTPLEDATESFWGYSGQPVILVPSGVCPIGNIGKTNQERFRTYFAKTVAILGENAGISPNCPDLKTPAKRQEESVIECSFYFGRLCLQGHIDGTMTIDGITLRTRVHDERTGGKDARLVIKNCIIDAPVPQNIIYVHKDFDGERSVVVTDCRADGINSMGAEGCLFCVCSGRLTVENLYMGNTRKFPGLTNYSGTIENRITELTVIDSLFENSSVVHGLTIRLPEDSQAKIRLENCRFHNFTPPEDPVLCLNLPEAAQLTLVGCSFRGSNHTPAVEVDGSVDRVTVTECSADGFTDLCRQKPARRTAIDPEAVYPIDDPHSPVENADFGVLDQLYAGRQCYYGDFHCHSNSGGTSDGQTPLADYVPAMKKLSMDFAAIVDHRQMRHFFLPEWDPQYLICGTEPNCVMEIPDKPAYARKFDYTMIFPDNTGLAKVMEAFPQFRYTGGTEGNYIYVNHTPEDFARLAEYVYSIGGLLSHAHPKQLLVSDDPMDYYFGDHVPLETVQGGATTFSTRQNRELWTTLLQMGKKVRTHGSSDSHGPVSNRGLTSVYAKRHYSTDIFHVIRSGDCVAGAVGMQMCIDGTVMGGETAYAPGKTFYLRTGRFHRDHLEPDTVYSLRVYTDQGLAYCREFDGTPTELALPVADRKFYRAEIFNESDRHTVALSNPIWLD